MMKKIYTILTVTLALSMWSFTAQNESLEIGSSTPAFAETVTNLKGENHVLREYLQPKGIMVVFSCNTCPFVLAWENRYAGLASYCKVNNMGFVLINSNEAKRNGDDSFQAMQAHAKEMKYDFPYVIDHNSTIANLMGAKTTPHVFIFDNEMRLFYKGAIDDNHKDAQKVTKTYALDALKSYIAGVKINTPTTNALGCSIKRVK